MRRLREELATEQHRTSEHIRDKHRILEEYEEARARLKVELATVTGQRDAAREALRMLVVKPPNRSKTEIPASDGIGTLEDQIHRALGAP